MEKEISPQNTKARGSVLVLPWKTLETCIGMYVMYGRICHELRPRSHKNVTDGTDQNGTELF